MEVLGGELQGFLYVAPFGIGWADSIFALCKLDRAIRQQVNNHEGFADLAVHVPRFVVLRIDTELRCAKSSRGRNLL